MFTEAFPIVTVRDLAGVVAFYRNALDGRVEYRYPETGPPEFVTVRVAGGEIGFAAATPATDADSAAGAEPATGAADAGPAVGSAGAQAAVGFELCVYAEDCDAAVARLSAAGATVTEAAADRPWGERVARLTDPAGIRLLICAATG